MCMHIKSYNFCFNRMTPDSINGSVQHLPLPCDVWWSDSNSFTTLCLCTALFLSELHLLVVPLGRALSGFPWQYRHLAFLHRLGYSTLHSRNTTNNRHVIHTNINTCWQHLRWHIFILQYYNFSELWAISSVPQLCNIMLYIFFVIF